MSTINTMNFRFLIVVDSRVGLDTICTWMLKTDTRIEEEMSVSVIKARTTGTQLTSSFEIPQKIIKVKGTTQIFCNCKTPHEQISKIHVMKN